MAKRMILMLTVTAAFVAALGFVKFRQIQTAIARGRRLPATSRGRHDHRRAAGGLAGHAERHRHDGRRPGRDGQRRPARASSIASRSIPAGRFARGRARPARHAAGAGAAGRRRGRARSGPSQLRPDAGPGERRRDLPGGVRPGRGRAEADGSTESERSAPRSSGKPSGRRFPESSASARSTWGSTWPAAIRSSRCSRCIRST